MLPGNAAKSAETFVAFQQIGQGSFHDEIFADGGGMDLFDHLIIHHPSEPQFIEKNNFLFFHGYFRPSLFGYPVQQRCRVHRHT
jgi:hypothetical protein